MRRREVLAGAASLGVLATGGVLATRGVPSVRDGAEPAHEPIEIRTVDAPGSEAGTITVPESGTIQVLDFFATTCTTCQSMMPTLGEANGAFGDDVTMLSVTIEEDEEAIREFWNEYDGGWSVGIDRPIDLYVNHDVTATPTMVVIDGDGIVHWERRGSKTQEEILEAVDTARDAYLE